MSRRPAGVPDYELFRRWPVKNQRAWLRHPAHLPRCCCGAWCVVYGPVLDDLDREVMQHAEDRCQPRREVIA